jgi:hypothetical protein
MIVSSREDNEKVLVAVPTSPLGTRAVKGLARISKPDDSFDMITRRDGFAY